MSSSGQGATILQEAKIPIVDNSQCNNIFQDPLTSNMLCSSGGLGTSVCQGDSGGPLVCLSSQNSWVKHLHFVLLVNITKL